MYSWGACVLILRKSNSGSAFGFGDGGQVRWVGRRSALGETRSLVKTPGHHALQWSQKSGWVPG